MIKNSIEQYLYYIYKIILKINNYFHILKCQQIQLHRTNKINKMEIERANNTKTILLSMSHKKPSDNSIKNYFSEIFKDLTSNPDKQLMKINKTIFTSYFNLPYFISSKIFGLFTSSDLNEINEEEFENGMMNLFYSDLSELVTLYFHLLESSNHLIYSENVRIFLLHFDLISKNQIDTNILNLLITNCLGTVGTKNKTFTLEEWKELLTINSDVFILIYYFLFHYRPFHIENIINYHKITNSKKHKRSQKNILFKIGTDNLILADSTNLLFQYINSHFGKNLIYKENNEPSKEDKEASSVLELLNDFEQDKEKVFCNCFLWGGQKKRSPEIYNTSINSKIVSHLQFDNRNEKSEVEKNNSNQGFQRKTYKRAVSKTSIQQEPFLTYLRKRTGLEEETTISSPLPFLQKLKFECLFTQSNLIYPKNNKFTVNTKDKIILKKCNITLINEEIFVLKYPDIDSADPPSFYKIICLRNALAFLFDNIIIQKTNYSILKIFSKNFSITKETKKKRVTNELKYYSFDLYFVNKEHAIELFEKISIVISTKNIEQFYDITEELFEENNGVLFKGFDHKTLSVCLIKTIDKSKINEKNEKLIQWEINIFYFLKRSTSKKQIKGIELLEDLNNIYLVFEYPKEGQLLFYLKKNKIEQITVVINLISQLIDIFEDLHSYGIVFGNHISPNIFIFKEGKSIQPKLISYENSRVLQMEEGISISEIGDDSLQKTIFAPEIQNNQSYFFSSDIWELGVLIYLLMYDSPPQINKNNIYELNFPKNSIFSKNHKDIDKLRQINELIQKCMDLDPQKRITIYQAKEIIKGMM